MEYKNFKFGDMTVVFGIENNQATMTMVPTNKIGLLKENKVNGYWPKVGVRVEPSMQIGIEGDGGTDTLSSGITYRNREQAFRFNVPNFSYEKNGDLTRLIATYNSDNLVAKQVYLMREGENCITTYCEVENVSKEDIVLENVPSFNISRISPFVFNNYDTEAYVYKMLNNWSEEGNLVKTDIKDLGFEESWFGIGVHAHRFGQAGNMPANGYLPWVAVEDRTNDCVWAVEIEAPGAWGIEVCHVYNGISISGGQGDFLSCHWKKVLHSEEKYTTRNAYITVCEGGIERACQNLVSLKQKLSQKNKIEEDIPLVYNEYCYTWGKPTEEKVRKQLEICKNYGFKYFVIDAGWYCKEGTSWRNIGDWNLNYDFFPSGLKKLSEECERYGIGLGIWFEFESVSYDSLVYKEHPDWVISYCGKPIYNNGRYILNMRKPEVIEYLKLKVIKFLQDNKIKYLKVDCNESLGIGIDGCESLGEGLREQINASIEFFNLIRREIPDIVIEMCSSGGMRHEAVWQRLGNLCSFSDAHEGFEGIVIASRLHRFIPPSKMLIWAVLKEGYSYPEVVVTLVKSLLGRPCISGDLEYRGLEIEKFSKFYEKAKSVILEGETIEIQNDITSFVSLKGRLLLKRVSRDRKKMLLYCFMLNDPERKELVPIDGYEVEDVYGHINMVRLGDYLGIFPNLDNISGGVALLVKK